MKLFLVHCGFYNETWGNNIYENHTNFFVAANDAQDARVKTKALPQVKELRMHVDGLIEIKQIDGFEIQLQKTNSDKTEMICHTHRELAPPKPQPAQ